MKEPSTQTIPLQQSFRNRRAINRYKRIFRPAAVAVNCSRHQLFSGSALTLDQHRSIRGRHSSHELEYFFHPGTHPYHIVLQVYFRLQRLVLLLEPFPMPQVRAPAQQSEPTAVITCK